MLFNLMSLRFSLSTQSDCSTQHTHNRNFTHSSASNARDAGYYIIIIMKLLFRHRAFHDCNSLETQWTLKQRNGHLVF